MTYRKEVQLSDNDSVEPREPLTAAGRRLLEYVDRFVVSDRDVNEHELDGNDRARIYGMILAIEAEALATPPRSDDLREAVRELKFPVTDGPDSWEDGYNRGLDALAARLGATGDSR